MADANSISRAAANGYECDTIKIVGLPYSDVDDVRRVVMAIGPRIEVKIAANAVTSVRFGTELEPGCPEQSIVDAAVGRPRRYREVFVRLAFPELRDVIISRLSERKGVSLMELDPSAAEDRPVHVHKLLVPERCRTFRLLMSESKKLKLHGFWHSFGRFFTRARSDGPVKRVYDVDDLRKFAD